MKEMDLMGYFNSKQLSVFAEKAKEIEAYLLSILKENGLTGHMYNDLEEFLADN